MVPNGGWAEIRAGCVIFEDDAVLVLDKPSGVSVMGERHDTDLVELAREAGERLYPVHRIDKVTSGVVLLAKQLDVHGPLTRQFTKRTVDKSYLAITSTTGLPRHGVIDLPLSVGRKNRVRIAAPRESIVFDAARARWSVPPSAVLPETRTYPSVTRFDAVWSGDRHTLLLARPETGRRHQLRVHLAWIGHPICHDPLFDRSPAAREGRTCLHSWQLAFDAAWLGRRVEVEAPPGEDFWAALGADRPAGGVSGLLDQARATVLAAESARS